MRLLNLRPAVFVALAFAAAGALSAQEWREAPTAIKQCERSEGHIVCSTWVREGDGYKATWPDGNVAKITIGLVDHLRGRIGAETTRYTFIREDQSGPTTGLKAIYECESHKGKKIVSGWKVWKVNGKQFNARWTGVFLDPPPAHGPDPAAVVPVDLNHAIPANTPMPGAPAPVAAVQGAQPFGPQNPLPASPAPARPQAPSAAASQQPGAPPPPGQPVFRILIPGRKSAPKPPARMPFEKWISCPEDGTC